MPRFLSGLIEKSRGKQKDILFWPVQSGSEYYWQYVFLFLMFFQGTNKQMEVFGGYLANLEILMKAS